MDEDEKKAAKYRKEAREAGVTAPVPQSAVQAAADEKARRAMEKAYNRSLTSPEMVNPPVAPATPGMLSRKHGGSVGSASKRADGIATKGKTRGTMITMKSGGMC